MARSDRERQAETDARRDFYYDELEKRVEALERRIDGGEPMKNPPRLESLPQQPAPPLGDLMRSAIGPQSKSPLTPFGRQLQETARASINDQVKMQRADYRGSNGPKQLTKVLARGDVIRHEGVAYRVILVNGETGRFTAERLIGVVTTPDGKPTAHQSPVEGTKP